MPPTNTIFQRLENYLEAILDLSRKHKVARVKDIASRIGVKYPTVTTTLRTLSDRGFVNYEPYHYVSLTDRGARAARDLLRRKKILRGFLAKVLLLDEAKVEAAAEERKHATADSEACRNCAAYSA